MSLSVVKQLILSSVTISWRELQLIQSLQFLDVLLNRGIVEVEQEAVWVCRATGQEPQDK